MNNSIVSYDEYMKALSLKPYAVVNSNLQVIHTTDKAARYNKVYIQSSMISAVSHFKRRIS